VAFFQTSTPAVDPRKRRRRMLFTTMAIASFERSAYRLTGGSRLDPPSRWPGRAGAPGVGARRSTTRSAMASRRSIHLDASVRVLSPLSPAGDRKGVCILRNGAIEQELDIMPDMDWVSHCSTALGAGRAEDASPSFRRRWPCLSRSRELLTPFFPPTGS